MRNKIIKISTICIFFILFILGVTTLPFVRKALASGEGVYVASVNGTEYETLGAAIGAAENGQTVLITESHTVTVETSDDAFVISEKEISIDLNGCTVTFHVNVGLTALFTTQNSGHLTLFDGSDAQNGTFDVVVAEGVECGNFVRCNAGCSIIFYSGNYRHNTSTSGSGMVDTRVDTVRGGKEGVYVYGGSFYLGNVGTLSNGSPWIFNGSSQNTKSVYVEGGTFNADVFHQYYPFEVDVPNTIALRHNADGTYTVVPAVCYVNEAHESGRWYINEIGYETYKEGFAIVDAEKYQVTDGYGTTLTVLEDCASLQDGLEIPQDRAMIVAFQKDFTIEEGFVISGNTELQINGDLYVNADVTIPDGAVINVVGNVFVAEEAQMTVSSLAQVNLLPSATEDLSIESDGSALSVYGTLVNDGTVTLLESGASVRAYGRVVNNGSMGTTEEFQGTVSIYEVAKIDATSDGIDYHEGTYEQSQTATTPYVDPPSSVYTEDETTFYPLTVTNPTVMLTGENKDPQLYETVQEAYENAQDGDTVTLLESVACEGLVIDKDITINFNGKTYTVTRCVGSSGTETNGLQILKGNQVVLKNGTLEAGTVTEGKAVKTLVQNYADLTVEDMILDGTGSAEMRYVLSNNSGNVSLTGETSITAPSGAVAFDVYDYSSAGYAAPTVNVDTTGVITGDVEISQTIEDNLVVSNGKFTFDVDVYCEVGYHALKSGEVYVVAEHTLQKTNESSPDCTQAGNSTYWTCTECGKHFSDEQSVNEIEENAWVIPALGHAEVPHAAQPATCTDIGWEAYETCSRCSYSTYEEIPALGHAEVPHAAQPATCTDIGWDAYETCSRCSYSTYEEISALGHAEVPHAAQPATCTDVGWEAYETCSRCSYSTYVEIPALGHAEVPHAAQPATCTDVGWEAYETCSRCSYSTYEEIPALGHDYSNGCDTDCNVCGGVRTVPAHASADGDGKCDTCDEKFTISNMEIALIVVAGIAVVAGIVIVIVIWRKKKPHNPKRKAVPPPVKLQNNVLAEEEISVAEAQVKAVEEHVTVEKQKTDSIAETESVEAQKAPAIESELAEEYTVPVAEAVETETAEEYTVPVAEAAEAETAEERAEMVGLGQLVVARYARSFLAKLIQAPEQTKQYYSKLKNALLSFRRVKSRVSWSFDSINFGREKLAKFVVRGKTLNVYFALDPKEIQSGALESIESGKFKGFARCKITSARRLKEAMGMVSDLEKKFGLTPIDRPEQDYVFPYEETGALVKKGLIKELFTKEKYDALLSMREKAALEIDQKHRDFVSAKEVNAILSDEVAKTVIEEVKSEERRKGKKAIINVDTLSDYFEANDVVTLETLREKGLIDSSVVSVKVLARGALNKPLTVSLQNYSLEAVKMIVLTGGKVRKVSK